MKPAARQPAPGRTWRGRTADERRQERRESLLEAGIEVFGTQGYQGSTVKMVCGEAGLTERYFYEAFDCRSELLEAIFYDYIERTYSAVSNAIDNEGGNIEVILRAGIEASAEEGLADPRLTRIQAFDVAGVSPAPEHKRRAAMHSFAGLVADKTGEHGGAIGKATCVLTRSASGLSASSTNRWSPTYRAKSTHRSMS